MEVVVVGIILGSIMFIVLKNNKNQKLEQKTRPQRDISNFTIYNYYKIPISVFINTNGIKKIADIDAKKEKSIHIDLPIKKDTIFLVFTSDRGAAKLLGRSTVVKSDNDIDALHCGMNSGHLDISMSSETSKSPLGTALGRLRIVNVTEKTLKLNQEIIIPPHRSYMYYGQYNNGIPLGTILKDQDGELEDYIINIPITDLFIGLVSDKKVTQFGGSKIGGEFDDTVYNYEFPLETTDIEAHKGMLIDTTYIPKNW